jgi:protocatechuate 3,4-dioxygenase beta subunit
MRRKTFDVDGRRGFIKGASAFALVGATLPPASACVQGFRAEDASGAGRPSRVEVAGRGEPGARLVMRGVVYGADEKPAAGVKIFLYQTDAAGFYSRPVSDPRRARLRATVWTDAQGRYEFETVKPAHYANVSSQPPMHIHVHLEPPGLPDHWVESFYFEDDPKLQPSVVTRARGLGRLSNVVKLEAAASGLLQGVRDFRVDAALAERNRLVNGWYS